MVVRYNRAARVVYGWVHDSTYADQNGQAAVLPFEGESASFSSLVKAYSGDVPPRAILDELVQVGVVERTNEGSIRLLARAYIPTAGEAEKLALLGRDVAGLIATMDKNIHGIGAKPFFQRKVYYDNIPIESVNELKGFINKKAQHCLEDINTVLVQHDRDHNKTVQGTKRMKIGLAIHYIEEAINGSHD